MKKLLLGSAALMAASAATAQTVNIGVLLGFTGPIETLTPPMADGADLAISEINAAGGVMGNSFAAVRADSHLR